MNNGGLHSISILGRDCAVGHETGFTAAFVLCIYFLENVLGKNIV